MDNTTTIRNRIGDTRKTEKLLFIGNGTTADYTLIHKNPYGIEITVGDDVLTDADYSYDAEIDKIVLNTAPADGENVIIKYNWSAFTDAEIAAFISSNANDVDKGTIEALRQLVGSQARMVTFSHGDRSVSMSDHFKNLMELLSYYEKKSAENTGAIAAGSVTMGERVMNDKPRPYQENDISRLYMG